MTNKQRNNSYVLDVDGNRYQPPFESSKVYLAHTCTQLKSNNILFDQTV